MKAIMTPPEKIVSADQDEFILHKGLRVVKSKLYSGTYSDISFDNVISIRYKN